MLSLYLKKITLRCEQTGSSVDWPVILAAWSCRLNTFIECLLHALTSASTAVFHSILMMTPRRKMNLGEIKLLFTVTSWLSAWARIWTQDCLIPDNVIWPLCCALLTLWGYNNLTISYLCAKCGAGSTGMNGIESLTLRSSQFSGWDTDWNTNNSNQGINRSSRSWCGIEKGMDLCVWGWSETGDAS